jgi:hypothetical protein
MVTGTGEMLHLLYSSTSRKTKMFGAATAECNRKSSKVWAITPVVLEVNKNPFMNDTSVHKFILAVL